MHYPSSQKAKKAIRKTRQAIVDATVSIVQAEKLIPGNYGDYIVYEVEKAGERIIEGIGDTPKKRVKRPSMRKGNKKRITIREPLLTGKLDKDGSMKYASRARRVVIEKYSIGDLVQNIISTDGTYKHEMFALLEEQARKLCYAKKGVSSNIKDALGEAAAAAGLCLVSKKTPGRRNMYRLMTDAQAATVVIHTLDQWPEAGPPCMTSGLRPTRYIQRDFIPYRAVILRQYMHNALASGAVKMAAKTAAKLGIFTAAPKP